MDDFHSKEDLINDNENTITNKNAEFEKDALTSGLSFGKTLTPEILVISSYPPRECGIATYSQDLIRALNNKFGDSFSLKVCALENGENNYHYPPEVKFILNTTQASEYFILSRIINSEENIKMVLIQHEFGLYYQQEAAFLEFLNQVKKPIITAFHTVLPAPDFQMKEKVRAMIRASNSIIVMTHKSSEVLITDYNADPEKITVIPHGTHLVPHLDKTYLKEKYDLKGRKVLSTFGLLSSGKGIDTTIKALPSIVEKYPEVIFLIIGKTHPGVIKYEGEVYRDKLISMVTDLNLSDHVIFINSYLELPELLEYLQLTDIYLFTSTDPNQAVSGTFSYAMGCACPIISTPIPHAKEVLTDDTGILIDFGNSQQLADAVIRLFDDEPLRMAFARNSLQKIVSTVWENSALAHALLLERIDPHSVKLIYTVPEFNLHHLHKMTTDFGMIQFSKITQPDIESGYTVDDNARALTSFAQHYQFTGEESDLYYMKIYLNFLKFCQQESGRFLNYVDKNKNFTQQNFTENLDDCNARALMALSYLITLRDTIPSEFIIQAEEMVQKLLPRVESIYSTRAMAMSIKGLYYLNTSGFLRDHSLLIILANRMAQMYRHESEPGWLWFESYLTYSNSILPEAMVYAWLISEKRLYREIALDSLSFLLSMIYNGQWISVISNKKWLFKGSEQDTFGEQSIDVTVTIQTLSVFYDVFGEEEYFRKMETAFNWFLGKNRLHQIIYNPCTGGCYDGLEDHHINLNEGAESSLSYFIARLFIERYRQSKGLPKGILSEKPREIESLVKKEGI